MNATSTIQNNTMARLHNPYTPTPPTSPQQTESPDAPDDTQENTPEKINAFSQTENIDPMEAAVIKELAARDREVRAHEMAHMAAGGRYVRGGARFDYQRGPDGKNYAVGGEVSIDTSPVPGDPEATIAKMQKIRAAALAPASPSSQDRVVAAKATQISGKARLESLEQKAREIQASKNESGTESESSSDPARETDNSSVSAYRQKAEPDSGNFINISI